MKLRIPIRSKLALALFIPVLALFAVSLYEVGQARQEVDRVRADTSLASAALGPQGLIRRLQDERSDSAISAVGLRASANLPTASLKETRESVDQAAVEFRRSLAGSGPAAEAVYRSALESFDRDTTSLRRTFDSAPGEASFDRLPLSNELWDGYSTSIDQFVRANTRLTLLIQDPELRSSAEMLDAVSRQVDELGVMVRTGIISSLSGGKVAGTTKNDVIRTINQFQGNKDRIETLATGPYAGAARGVVDNPAYQSAVKYLEQYIRTDKLDTTTIIEAVSKRPVPNLDTVATETTDALKSRSATLLDNAEARQRNFVGLALLVLIVGGAFMMLAARSITRPLRSLTGQAREMASDRLPSAVQQILDTPLGEDVILPDVQPVVVKTRDEVRDVVTALNQVQQSALDLAVEQAVLRRNIADSFVNLGRRTQNLIGRQLDFITELERNETDPEALDNLFKLDHLATRARRNAESLVVLAGLVTPRTWSAPIAMGDVVRAALGEVEDYQRVEVRSVGEATVPGGTAADLVHLLAEMLENGLSFSPPGRPVEMYGRMTRQGYLLAVVDQGIGMTEAEYASANDRLAGRESYTVAPSRYLGHYVAGSLAQRIGAHVSLVESPTGGVAAKVLLPAEVLEDAPAIPAIPALSPRTDADRLDDGVGSLSLGAGEVALAPSADRSDDAGHPGAFDASDEPDHSGAQGPLETTGIAEPNGRTEHGLRRRVRGNHTQASDTVASDDETVDAVETGPGADEGAPEPAVTRELIQPDETNSDQDDSQPDLVPADSATPDDGEAESAPAEDVGVREPDLIDPAFDPRSQSWGRNNGDEAPVELQPSLAPATTTNGLQRRVPGERLTPVGAAPVIRRGNGDGSPPADSAAADGMFSLLANFESGVKRGLDDLSSIDQGTSGSNDTGRED